MAVLELEEPVMAADGVEGFPFGDARRPRDGAGRNGAGLRPTLEEWLIVHGVSMT